jgi:hypothetical protein
VGDVPDYSRQPVPVRSEHATSAHDLVGADLLGCLGPIPGGDLLLADLSDRKAYGLRKYGTVLHVNNGRDHTLDAFEEVIDLLVYSRMMMAEDPTLADGEFFSDYLHLLSFAARLRLMMSERAL